MEQRRLLGKAAVVGGLTLALMIPLMMILGTVLERRGLRDGVIADIARSATGSQKILGPVLVVPYRERIERVKRDADTGKTTVEIDFEDRFVTLLPERLEIAGAVATEERYRGIHKALLYNTTLGFAGSFAVPAHFGLADRQHRIQWGQAYLALGVPDVRGIKARPTLRWQAAPLAFAPGANDAALTSGLHAPLGELPTAAAAYEFAFELALQGMERLELVPVGRDTVIELRSAWPHPSFIGRFLPETRTVTDAGFTARWRTSYFSTNVEQLLNQCGGRECAALSENALGVAFIQPVDLYLKAERAVKYGVLFVGLTFAVFFLFELFKRLAIHPIQYGLVGIALAIFYLLLLSLSEHLGFGLSYFIAATACVGLLGFYTAYVLKSARHAAGFATLLAGLYGALYVLLQLEDFALLMGSLLLFVILTAVMVLTRKVDWYQLGRGAEPALRAEPSGRGRARSSDNSMESE
jgi:inner membrane protein